MKILQLHDPLYDYLVHILEEHRFHPEHGLAAFHLWEAVKHATHIDDAQVKAMASAGAPQGQSSPAPETEPELEGGARG